MKFFIIPHPTKNFNHLYTCPRGEAIVKQGLAAHPEVELVDSPDKADYYILDYVPHANGEKWNTSDIEQYYSDKLIIIDYTDEHDKTLVPINKCFLYFKRSYLQPDIPVGQNSICIKNKPIKLAEEGKVWPISYGILDEFPRILTPLSEREINMGCYLRCSCFNRGRVLNFAKGLAHMIPNSVVGAVNNGSRSIGGNIFVDIEYFNCLGNTKFLLSCYPSFWVGDSRFAEALSAGCLLFLDEDTTPYQNKLVDSKHYISYKINDLADLRRKLIYYNNNIKKAENIAKEGQKFALEYYTSKGIMKTVLERINERRIN